MDTPRITRAMATRERRITPMLRRLGTVRHADFRSADAYLRRSPEMVRVINEAIRDVEEGRYVIGSREELRAPA